MNPVIEQAVKLFREMSLFRRIAIGVIVLMMAAGFSAMFIWANKTEYKPAYTELSQDDAGAIVSKLKESKIPYKIAGGGTVILVPAARVYDVRLSLAKDGIPKGSGVGYEIFDKTDFGTTEFVQKINRKRALQGELARTIRAFDEVKNARVMIVLPKESVFVEETKKPSASILVELKKDLDQEKVSAIAHLVASAVQDLTPRRITIVDTTGRILFEGKSEEQKAMIKAKNLVDTQYHYKVRFESNMADRIQTMLERIVGTGKAIVRVTSEMDFSTRKVHEDIYDPLERETKFVRSEKNLAESSNSPVQQGTPSSVNPVVPSQGKSGTQAVQTINKKDNTINYELSRRTSQIAKPMAVLTRLSVAAVIDGKYTYRTDKNGNKVKTYVPRSKAEMQQFSDLVAKAMGYDQSRQDQVSMECFPFASINELGKPEKKLTGWRMVQKEYGRTIANILLVLLVFLFVIMPIMKTVKTIKSSADQNALPQPDGVDLIEGGKDTKEPDFMDMTAKEQRDFLDSMSPEEKETFIRNMNSSNKAAYLARLNASEKAAYYARQDVAKTANIIKGWISEIAEEDE